MALVSSVDYVLKRIYLSSETVDTELDTLLVYKEVRALRRLNEDHRKFYPIIIGGGNVTKIPNVSATPAYVQLLHGCRIVPFKTMSHSLKLIRDTFTDDFKAGIECFDRTEVSETVAVDIDVDFPEIEIKYLAGGASALTNEQDTMLRELYRLGGLDPTKPLVVTDSARTAGAEISQTIVTNPTTTTVTRV